MRIRLTCACCFLFAHFGLGTPPPPSEHEPWFSEIFIDPPGNSDLRETIELSGASYADLGDYWILAIDGNAAAGRVDAKRSLFLGSIGFNGTTYITETNDEVFAGGGCEGTFYYLFETITFLDNNAATYVLGRGTLPFEQGFDLDANNDGLIDDPSLFAGFTVVDAVGIEDNGGVNRLYAGQLGGMDLPRFAFEPDALYRLRRACDGGPDGWAGGKITGPAGGPYEWDAANVFGWTEAGVAVPSPAFDFGCLNKSSAPCAADVNCDRFVSGDDADLFATWFVAGSSLADFNDDGFVNGDDFDEFVTSFELGC